MLTAVLLTGAIVGASVGLVWCARGLVGARFFAEFPGPIVEWLGDRIARNAGEQAGADALVGSRATLVEAFEAHSDGGFRGKVTAQGALRAETCASHAVAECAQCESSRVVAVDGLVLEVNASTDATHHG